MSEERKDGSNKEEKLFNYTVRGTHKGEETNIGISDDLVEGAKKLFNTMLDIIFGGDDNGDKSNAD